MDKRPRLKYSGVELMHEELSIKQQNERDVLCYRDKELFYILVRKIDSLLTTSYVFVIEGMHEEWRKSEICHKAFLEKYLNKCIEKQIQIIDKRETI